MPSDPLISPSPSFIEVLKCYGPDLLAVTNPSLKVPAPLELGIVAFTIQAGQHGHKLTIV